MYIDLSTSIEHKKVIYDIINVDDIHKRFSYSAGMIGAIYGIGIVCFFNYLPILNQVYLLLLIAVMTPAGLVSFSSDKLSFDMYVYPLLIPPIIWLFLQGQFEYFYIGICSIIYHYFRNLLFTLFDQEQRAIGFN